MTLTKVFKYPLLSQKRVKLRTSNLASTFTGPSKQKPVKSFGEKGAWAYSGTAQSFKVPPIISGTGKVTDFIWPIHSEGPSEQKPIKNFGEKGAWAWSGTVQRFKVPPIIPRRGKATDLKFYMHTHRIDLNKSYCNEKRVQFFGPPRSSYCESITRPVWLRFAQYLGSITRKW